MCLTAEWGLLVTLKISMLNWMYDYGSLKHRLPFKQGTSQTARSKDGKPQVLEPDLENTQFPFSSLQVHNIYIPPVFSAFPSGLLFSFTSFGGKSSCLAFPAISQYHTLLTRNLAGVYSITFSHVCWLDILPPASVMRLQNYFRTENSSRELTNNQ